MRDPLFSRRSCFALAALLAALSGNVTADDHAFDAVDGAFDNLVAGVSETGLDVVLEIDHARLAAEAGQPMPPARVILFDDAEAVSHLLAADVRAGLDLPMRALAYWNGESTAVIHTGAGFIARRHGLPDSPWLERIAHDLAGALSATDPGLVSAVPAAAVAVDFGILEIDSPHDFAGTVERLKRVVTAQSDTVWFGEIDFRDKARAFDIDLPQATLLLFGGPAPGGVAMREFPAIGLDAFCQKLLVYQDETGAVQVIYNDIAALAQLHYGRAAPPHHGLNQRLTATFRAALAAHQETTQ